MDLNARADVNILGSTSIFERSLRPNYATDFFILISINYKVPLILHTKFQPNILSRSAENGDFISFAIFSNGGHLEFSTRLNFTILKPWSLLMLRMKFEILGCSGYENE